VSKTKTTLPPVQDSDKMLATDKLAQKLETVVDSPDGKAARRQSEDRRRRQAVAVEPLANE